MTGTALAAGLGHHAADLSHWWGHRVDWGNVPAWIASLLTGLSVLLALTIIFRDKRRDRQELARQVIFTSVIEYLKEGSPHLASVKVTLHNMSSGGVFRPGIDVYPKRKHRKTARTTPFSIPFVIPGYHEDDVTALEPNGKAVMRFPIDDHADDLTIQAGFSDGRGNVWLRDLDTQKLRELR